MVLYQVRMWLWSFRRSSPVLYMHLSAGGGLRNTTKTSELSVSRPKFETSTSKFDIWSVTTRKTCSVFHTLGYKNTRTMANKQLVSKKWFRDYNILYFINIQKNTLDFGFSQQWLWRVGSSGLISKKFYSSIKVGLLYIKFKHKSINYRNKFSFCLLPLLLRTIYTGKCSNYLTALYCLPIYFW
jgi:hypothetical protein